MGATTIANSGARANTRTRTTGYLFALAAGATWGTTGPLSTALYAEGAQLTQVGFWRVALATLGFALYAVIIKREIFRIDRAGLLLIILVGGALVALFEVAGLFDPAARVELVGTAVIPDAPADAG